MKTREDGDRIEVALVQLIGVQRMEDYCKKQSKLCRRLAELSDSDIRETVAAIQLGYSEMETLIQNMSDLLTTLPLTLRALSQTGQNRPRQLPLFDYPDDD